MNRSTQPVPARHGIARALSKLGLASRTQAAEWVRAGRIDVNGRRVEDAEFPVRVGIDRIDIDGQPAQPSARMVIMLNKPRGLITSTRDERGRDTVYRCLDGAQLPWLAPIGRLDKASEGMLLMSNDPAWSARITDPATGPDKTYHVQVDRLVTPEQLLQMQQGVGEPPRAFKAVRELRRGVKHAWLEITLDEGRNRQIRRVLESLDIGVLRLIRVSIGPLQLGTLPKGSWRVLSDAEVDSL